MKSFFFYLFFTCVFYSEISLAQVSKIEITVCIIGNSKLHIKEGKMFWEDLGNFPPGTSYECTVVTRVNGRRWDDWKTPFDLGFNTDSFAIVGKVIQKNQISVLVQAPSAENGWETIWWFNDPIERVHTYITLFELTPVPKIKKAPDQKTKPLKIVATLPEFIPNNISFEVGSAILTKESLPELDKIYSSIKLSNDKIEIGGHTNNIGEKEKLRKLSEERALTVYNYLLKKGLSKDRMTYYGYGDTQPILSNETEEGKTKNRRVEIKIIK